MKRLLSSLVSRAVNSPRPTARPASHVRLGMDLLEGRSMPSYFMPFVQVATQYTGNSGGIPDAIVGAIAPQGHV
jgi:hypothetical protein